ncbi:MAG: aminotransferase class IV [Candidatus Omnitrophota bacterium]
MKNAQIWINGRFYDAQEARVSVNDRGFLYGDGVFETMRSYAGAVFMLNEHIRRLFKSLKFLEIKLPYSKVELEKAIYRTLMVNGLKNACVRITVTRGEGGSGINYERKSIPNVVIITKRFDGYPDRSYDRGIKAKIVPIRQNEFSPVSNFKTISFLNYILARSFARKDDFDEAILINTEGYVAEAATGNVFLVKGKRLVTPSVSSGILPGIARSAILKIAGRIGISVRESRILRKELLSGDEIFLTNSLAEVLPVTKIDSKKIGAGRAGEITRLFHILYQRQVIEEVIHLKP